MRIDGELVHWHRKTKIAVVEASTLNLPVGEFPDWIEVVSHKTGNIQLFDYIGQMQYGTRAYRPRVGDHYRGVEGWCLHVLND